MHPSASPIFLRAFAEVSALNLRIFFQIPRKLPACSARCFWATVRSLTAMSLSRSKKRESFTCSLSPDFTSARSHFSSSGLVEGFVCR